MKHYGRVWFATLLAVLAVAGGAMSAFFPSVDSTKTARIPILTPIKTDGTVADIDSLWVVVAWSEETIDTSTFSAFRINATDIDTTTWISKSTMRGATTTKQRRYNLALKWGQMLKLDTGYEPDSAYQGMYYGTVSAWAGGEPTETPFAFSWRRGASNHLPDVNVAGITQGTADKIGFYTWNMGDDSAGWASGADTSMARHMNWLNPTETGLDVWNTSFGTAFTVGSMGDSMSNASWEQEVNYWREKAVPATTTDGVPVVTTKFWGTGTTALQDPVTNGSTTNPVVFLDSALTGNNSANAVTGREMQAMIVSAGPITTASGAVTTVTNLTNAPTAGDLTATMKTSVQTAAAAAITADAEVDQIKGDVDGLNGFNPATTGVLLTNGTGTGQIVLSSGQVTVGTNNDKAGYSLTTADWTTDSDLPTNFLAFKINASGGIYLDSSAATDDLVMGGLEQPTGGGGGGGDITSINGSPTAAQQLAEAFDNDGTGGDLDLSSLSVTGTTTFSDDVTMSDGLIITSNTATRAGLTLTGNTTGAGLQATGGETGSGIVAQGGGTAGNGMQLQGIGTTDGLRNGLRIIAANNSSAVNINATGTGSAIACSTGTTSGANVIELTARHDENDAITFFGTDNYEFRLGRHLESMTRRALLQNELGSNNMIENGGFEIVSSDANGHPYYIQDGQTITLTDNNMFDGWYCQDCATTDWTFNTDRAFAGGVALRKQISVAGTDTVTTQFMPIAAGASYWLSFYTFLQRTDGSHLVRDTVALLDTIGNKITFIATDTLYEMNHVGWIDDDPDADSSSKFVPYAKLFTSTYTGPARVAIFGYYNFAGAADQRYYDNIALVPISDSAESGSGSASNWGDTLTTLVQRSDSIMHMSVPDSVLWRHMRWLGVAGVFVVTNDITPTSTTFTGTAAFGGAEPGSTNAYTNMMAMFVSGNLEAQAKRITVYSNSGVPNFTFGSTATFSAAPVVGDTFMVLAGAGVPTTVTVGAVNTGVIDSVDFAADLRALLRFAPWEADTNNAKWNDIQGKFGEWNARAQVGSGGGGSASLCGSGAQTDTIFAVDTTGTVTRLGSTRINVYSDAARTTLVASGTTFDWGGIVFNLDASTIYYTTARRAGYVFPNRSFTTGSGGVYNDSVTAAEQPVVASAGPDQCTIRGYVENYFGDPVENAAVEFRPRSSTAARSGNVLFLPTYKSVPTDSTGYFEAVVNKTSSIITPSDSVLYDVFIQYKMINNRAIEVKISPDNGISIPDSSSIWLPTWRLP